MLATPPWLEDGSAEVGVVTVLHVPFGGEPMASDPPESSLTERLWKLFVSIAILTFVTVVVGYGGWLVLTVSAALGGPDPETDDGDLLRERLLAWPERNREFMRNDGHGELPVRP
jgi:hypothetical protein